MLHRIEGAFWLGFDESLGASSHHALDDGDPLFLDCLHAALVRGDGDCIIGVRVRRQRQMNVQKVHRGFQVSMDVEFRVVGVPFWKKRSCVSGSEGADGVLDIHGGGSSVGLLLRGFRGQVLHQL